MYSFVQKICEKVSNFSKFSENFAPSLKQHIQVYDQYDKCLLSEEIWKKTNGINGSFLKIKSKLITPVLSNMTWSFINLFFDWNLMLLNYLILWPNVCFSNAQFFIIWYCKIESLYHWNLFKKDWSGDAICRRRTYTLSIAGGEKWWIRHIKALKVRLIHWVCFCLGPPKIDFY